MTTEVLFAFDTEDFTTQRNADAILGLANMLMEEGVTGHFAVVGLVAQQLLAWKRQDVIAALAPHVIGYHTYSHSVHPVLAEMCDVEDVKIAEERATRQEELGLELIHKAFPDKKILFAVPPGNDVSYPALYYYAEQGIPFYFGGYIHDETNTLLDYCGLTQIPYTISMEELFLWEPRKDLDKVLDKLSRCRRVIIYHHPNMSVKKVFWDMANYNGRNIREFGDWIETEDRTLGETITFWGQFRRFIRRLKADSRFTLTDAHAILKARNHHLPPPITQADLPPLANELNAALAPTRRGPYCIADIFYALTEFLRGGEVYKPGLVKGFLAEPHGIREEVTLTRADIVQAAQSITTGEYIPETLWVGGTAVGPADFLHAMLQTLLSDQPAVSVTPRPQRVDIRHLQELCTLAMKGTWIFSPDFQDTYITSRLRLQDWTLRSYDF